MNAEGIDTKGRMLDLAAIAARPTRPHDFGAEGRALDRLLAVLGDDTAGPGDPLMQLCTAVVSLTLAQSAGISVLQGERFEWSAIAGAWARYRGGSMPVDAAPCGIVLAADQPLLVEEPTAFFPDAPGGDPPIVEMLLVPLRIDARVQGTLWALSHDPALRFDVRDAELLHRFALLMAGVEQTRRAVGDPARAQGGALRATLSVLQRVVRTAMMRDDAADLDTLRAQMGGRIGAFVRGALAGEKGAAGAPLDNVIGDQLPAFGERVGGRIDIEGPEITVGASDAGLVALIVHELVDDAHQTGSLRAAEGRADVTWTVADAVLMLTFAEEGGEAGELPVAAPSFLIDLIEAGGRSGGRCERVATPGGRTTSIALPLS